MKNIIRFYVFAILCGVILTTVGMVHAGSLKREVVGEINQLNATPPSRSEFKLELEVKDSFADFEEFKGRVVGEHKIYVDPVDVDDLLDDTFELILKDDGGTELSRCTLEFDSFVIVPATNGDPAHAKITYKALGRLEVKDGNIEKARLRGCTAQEAIDLAQAEAGDTITIEGPDSTTEVANFTLENKEDDF